MKWLVLGIESEALESRTEAHRRLRIIELDPPPAETLLAEITNMDRVNSTAAKGFNKGHAVAQIVIRHQVGVGRNERAKVLPERDGDRRTVVECPDAHRQHVICRLRGLG